MMNLAKLNERESQTILATDIYCRPEKQNMVQREIFALFESESFSVGGFCLCKRCIYMHEECFLSPLLLLLLPFYLRSWPSAGGFQLPTTLGCGWWASLRSRQFFHLLLIINVLKMGWQNLLKCLPPSLKCDWVNHYLAGIIYWS